MPAALDNKLEQGDEALIPRSSVRWSSAQTSRSWNSPIFMVPAADRIRAGFSFHGLNHSGH